MNISKTTIFNVTYLGQVIYETVQETVVVNKKVGLLNRNQVGDIFGTFADAIKNMTVDPILEDIPVIGNALLEAIARGYIEHPQASYKSRGCLPLRNKHAQAVIDRMFKEIDEHKLAYIETLGNIEDETTIDYLPFIAKEELGAKLKTRGTSKADYYFDKKGNIGFNDEAINMNYNKTSDELDPENGQPSRFYILEVIRRNKRAKEAGQYPKDACLVCGETFIKKSKNSRQVYCDGCKKEVDKLRKQEKMSETRRLRSEVGTIPSTDYGFIKYMNGFYLKHKSTENITRKDIVKTKELKPRGVKPDTFKPEPCECGSNNFEIYKPWKPDETGACGKIGSKVLYCKDCGLVLGYGQQSTATTDEV